MPIHKNGELIADRYQIRQHLGSGGLGEVFLCLDTVTKKQVALKRLRADLAFPDYVIEQTEREARLLAPAAEDRTIHPRREDRSIDA